MSESLKRAVRTAVQTFIGVFAVSLTGWLNSVIGWASNDDQVASPSVLGKAAVAGVAAAIIGLVAWLQNAAEHQEWWPGWFKATSWGRALRTAVQTFLGVFLIAVTGFLTQLGDWATTGGNVPDLAVLGGAAVAGFTAAVVGLVSWAQNALEDGTAFPSFLKGGGGE